ncbi:hypothetical protein M8J76_002683 [Diaphorina citri]|nr:hypothetical protein M8J75_008722 [Diaphorina citri]KAI5736384.1 hypothetical protein M8J76_002683 [Diaphorina citri]
MCDLSEQNQEAYRNFHYYDPVLDEGFEEEWSSPPKVGRNFKGGEEPNGGVGDDHVLRGNGNAKYARSTSVPSGAPGEVYRLKEKIARSNKKPKPSEVQHFTRSQWISLVALGMVDFVGFCSMSIMAPFFPKEAALKDMSVSYAGFVFSFYALVMFLSAPVFGKIMSSAGTKFIFVSGVFVTGTCNVLFGLLPQIRSNSEFAIYCFLVRGMEALGASAFSTASFVYVIHLFPDNVGAVLGILETFVGLGMSIGPALGGILYSIGGFALPFYILGFLMILLVPVYLHVLPSVQGSQNVHQTTSLFKLLKIPSVLLIAITVVIASNVWAFLDPTLEPHLRDLNLSSSEMGFVFLLFSALYGIFSPFWGYIADKIDNHWSMMVTGLLLTTVGLLLLGPSGFLPYNENVLWLNLVSLSIIGVSVSLTLMPTFKGLLQCAIDNGFKDSIATYSIVAGLWSCAYSLGDMLGPSIGGVLLEQFNFPVCATSMAIMSFITAIVCLAYFGLNKTPLSRKKYNRYKLLEPLSPLTQARVKKYGALDKKYDSAITVM